jgi:hypothetical protein
VEPITAKLASWVRLRAASTPIMPKASVISAAGSSQGSASPDDSPAPSPKASGNSRRMEYAPTLVMIANRAATGAGALE